MNTLRWLVIASIVALIVRAKEPDVHIVSNVVYLEAARAEKLDVYLPSVRATDVRSPAFVWIHGGGFVGGTKNESRAVEICSTLAHHGYVAVSIDYQLRPVVWPQALFDCKNAVRFLRANAVRYQIDPDRVAIGGGSAGGFLALMVGFTSGDDSLAPTAPYPHVADSVRCVIDMYGPTTIHVREPSSPNSAPRAISVLDLIRPNSPSVLILHGRADSMANSEPLSNALKAAGVAHEIVLLDNVGHSFDWEKWRRKPLPRDLRPVALGFLAKHLDPASQR